MTNTTLREAATTTTRFLPFPEGRYANDFAQEPRSRKAVQAEDLNECKNTPDLANRIRGYTDKTHLRGFQIPRVRVGGQLLETLFAFVCVATISNRLVYLHRCSQYK
jgi:hypothetical protein